MTLKCFAVSFIGFHVNDLETEIIYAENWRQAAVNHTGTCFARFEYAGEKDANGEEVCSRHPEINEVPETIEDAKTKAFDLDYMFDIKWLDIIGDEHGNLQITAVVMDELSPIPGAGYPDPSYEAIEGLDEDRDQDEGDEETVVDLPGSIDNPQNSRD